RADMAIRAATLIAATLVALPVILFYDLLPATIAIAWLIRDARRHFYLPWEKTILCAMWPVALLCRGIGEKTDVPIGWLLTFGLPGLARFRPDSRDAVVGLGGALEHGGARIVAEMARDFLHLADPAIGLGIDG